MAERIEDYALVGNCETAGLVGRDGSVDWLCLPRFDSAACFAALLGTHDHGRWLLAPAGEVRAVRRRYRDGTLVLETEYETDDGAVALIDCMPPRTEVPYLIRVVEGRRGQVPMRLELTIRLAYGSLIPWVRRADDGIVAVGGPDALRLRTPVELRGEDFKTVADFAVSAGQRVPFALTWFPSHRPEPAVVNALDAVEATTRWWQEWSARCRLRGAMGGGGRALAHHAQGAHLCAHRRPGGCPHHVAAGAPGRGAQLGLSLLLAARRDLRPLRPDDRRLRRGGPCLAGVAPAGRGREALAGQDPVWRRRRAAAPGVGAAVAPGLREVGAGADRKRRRGSVPARRDGEVADVLHCARRVGLEIDENAWRVEKALVAFVESVWSEPDEGIWEVRGPRRLFTHLLAEEYDPVAGRLLGNFPQTFSHVGLVNTARNLTERGGPAEHRQER